MKTTTILTNVYRLLRIEEEDGTLVKHEIIKSLSIEDVIRNARKELINGNDINIEVW